MLKHLKRSKKLVIVVLFLLVLLILVIWFVFGRNRPSFDLSLTYTNSKFNYSFNYPTNSEIYVAGVSPDDKGFEPYTYEQINYNDFDKTNSTCEIQVDKKLNGTRLGYSGEVIKKIGNMTVNNSTWEEYVYSYEGWGGLRTKFMLRITKKEKFHLRFFSYDKQERFSPLCEQIFSTLIIK